MPRMSHWMTPEVISVPAVKVEVYRAQGWQVVRALDEPETSVTLDEKPAPAPAPKPPAKKKAAPKRRAAKKSVPAPEEA